MCRLWPGITPHRSGMPGSVWDLECRTWITFAQATDQYLKDREEANR